MSAPVDDVTPIRVSTFTPTSPPSRRERVAGTLATFPSKAALGCIALGILLIVIGAAGVRSATVSTGSGGEVVAVVAQLPYLMSGGIGGLALVILGAALLIVQSHRVDSERLRATLTELVRAQTASLPVEAPAPDDVAGLVVAGSSSYHRPGCRLVEGRTGQTYLLPLEAEAQGLKACRVCQPASS